MSHLPAEPGTRREDQGGQQEEGEVWEVKHTGTIEVKFSNGMHYPLVGRAR